MNGTYPIVPLSGEILPTQYSGRSGLSGLLEGVCDSLHAGQRIKSQTEVAIAMINAKEHRDDKELEILLELASGTKDDQIRQQMFDKLLLAYLRG